MKPKKIQGLAIVQLCYGLLRINEVKKLTVDDVTIKSDPKEIEVTFFHASKRTDEGFTLDALVTFYDMFVKYVK